MLKTVSVEEGSLSLTDEHSKALFIKKGLCLYSSIAVSFAIMPSIGTIFTACRSHYGSKASCASMNTWKSSMISHRDMYLCLHNSRIIISQLCDPRRTGKRSISV